MSGGLAYRLGTRIAALAASVMLAASAGLLLTPAAVMHPALAAAGVGSRPAEAASATLASSAAVRLPHRCASPPLIRVPPW